MDAIIRTHCGHRDIRVSDANLADYQRSRIAPLESPPTFLATPRPTRGPVDFALPL